MIRSSCKPADREEQARLHRRDRALFGHNIRQVARAEMDLRRHHEAGADAAIISAAAAALEDAQRRAGMLPDAA